MKKTPKTQALTLHKETLATLTIKTSLKAGMTTTLATSPTSSNRCP